MNDKKNKNQSGSVLLYTMLALAVIINTIIVISSLVVGELRQASNVDNSYQAYYQAESGLEWWLYKYRKAQDVTLPVDESCGLAGFDCTVESIESNLVSLPITLTKNDSYHINFSQPGGAESLVLNWANNGSWVEVTLLEWDPVAANWNDASINKVLLSGGSGIVNAISATKQYQIRVKALYDTVSGTAELYDGNNGAGSAVSIPDSVTLTAVGTHNNATSQVSASFPPSKSTLGLFDYVLFSEKSIIK